jgi:hypothetical protein
MMKNTPQEHLETGAITKAQRTPRANLKDTDSEHSDPNEEGEKVDNDTASKKDGDTEEESMEPEPYYPEDAKDLELLQIGMVDVDRRHTQETAQAYEES